MTRSLLLVLLFIHATSAASAEPSGEAPPPGDAGAAKGSSVWQTLHGEQPKVVAHGGFSGLYPQSTPTANAIAALYPKLILLCNLQITMDKVGICVANLDLSEGTSIAVEYPNKTKTYKVNGKDVTGYFSVDYAMNQLNNVIATQSVLSRPDAFDIDPIPTFDDFRASIAAPRWIHVEYPQFYDEHKLSYEDYFDKNSLRGINYLSTPELTFLKAISAMKPPTMKLYFAFKGREELEPTTNQTYGELLLDKLKPMITGIVVPREYIWPVEKSNYLAPEPNLLVADAHELGLEVYVYGFANDNVLSYNYSYDPTEEYLQFTSKGFSVDGFITDFPPTAMNAVECFAKYNNSESRREGQPLVITNGGASGIYAGSTDLAYQKAVDDEADIIDCSVQMSKDGVAFCMATADLSVDTTAAAIFPDRATTIPEIQKDDGIFSFDLEWSDIQSLQPQLSSPFEKTSDLKRNPAVKNEGKFMTLDQFLQFAKAKSVPGILINIDNAAYLASKEGHDVVTTVSTALHKASFDKQTTQQVLIQSDDTSVLAKFSNLGYKRVLAVKEEVSDIPKATVDEIKKYADAVTLTRFSIIPTSHGFTRKETNSVLALQAANLSVFVTTLNNEYLSLAFDYNSDAMFEIATYTQLVQVNGTITEYPGTANKYLKNPCSNLNDPDLMYAILPINPGQMLNLTKYSENLSPPKPALAVKDIADPPLPPAIKVQDGAPPPGSSACAHSGLSIAAMALLSLLNGLFHI
ncbi:unnamed protein product [Linum tenue]|uniref:glycerophosphodiester phosphodiesterase n=1 Tax=Linum tenue TaxID=586396 RepID=A0AAV0QCF6_9ROSI|nr:unnamed protein product [Linum tenue]